MLESTFILFLFIGYIIIVFLFIDYNQCSTEKLIDGVVDSCSQRTEF